MSDGNIVYKGMVVPPYMRKEAEELYEQTLHYRLHPDSKKEEAYLMHQALVEEFGRRLKECVGRYSRAAALNRFLAGGH